jgi:hypothetical protein
MKHTICFIDDKIPVSQYNTYFNDTGIINESVLGFLLKNKDTVWEDLVVKKMCEELLEESKKWSISAFTAPDFYNNYIQETVYAPEVIIYDWDYNAVQCSNESEDCLLEILRTSYTIVFIFSEEDNISEINGIMQKDEFKKFQDRLSVINKSEENSIDLIFKNLEEKENSNFAFRYGHKIIYNSNKAVNKILSDISQLSIERFSASIGKLNAGRYVVTNEDFIDVIIPRYRKLLSCIDENDLSIAKTEDSDIHEIKKVWSYRLYDETDSNTVSMGDIIKKEKGGYFLVVSSDCHLNRFWKKNGGYISVIPLNRIDSKIGKEVRNFMIEGRQIFSSINSSQITMTVLPAVPVSTKELRDFLVLPKSIISINVSKPESSNKNNPLTYDSFIGYNRIASIMDPFKFPLIHFIMDNITGYGSPDFPNDLKNYLSYRINKK